MVKISTYTEQAVVEQTSEVIRLFYGREIAPIAAMLDEHFVWIGAYEFQYLRGKKEFLDSIQNETDEPPCQVSQEEFFVLAHDRSLWTVYGRFTVTALREDGVLLIAKVRNTFVWQQVGDALMLLHIHGSHARDVPLELNEQMSQKLQIEGAWFDYIRGIDRTIGPPKKLVFRDQDGTYHFVLPSEIVYVKTEDKLCVIYTDADCFLSRVSLKELEPKSPLFQLIHRGYLVNLQRVKTIQRYQVKLTNDTILPVGKERYMNLKQALHDYAK